MRNPIKAEAIAYVNALMQKTTVTEDEVNSVELVEHAGEAPLLTLDPPVALLGRLHDIERITLRALARATSRQ